MSDNKSSDSRRKLLKSIAAGSGAVIAGKNLPESWSRPVVDSVMLPAHAVTTPCGGTEFEGKYVGNAGATRLRCNDVTDSHTPRLTILIGADCFVTVEYGGSRPFSGVGTIVGDTFTVSISRTQDCNAQGGNNAGSGTVTGTVSGNEISGTASFGGDCICQQAPARPNFSSTGTYTIYKAL